MLNSALSAGLKQERLRIAQYAHHRIVAALTLMLVLCATFALVSVTLSSTILSLTTVIAVQSAPSVVLAQQTLAYMSDADAQLANIMAAKAGDNIAAYNNFATRTATIQDVLAKVSQMAGTGSAEEKSIESLSEGFGTYERLVGQAEILHERDDPAELVVLNQAMDLMNTRIRPSAQQLDNLSSAELEHNYQAVRVLGLIGIAVEVLLGLLLLWLLVATQRYTTHKFNRQLNIGLVIAMVCVLLASGYGSFALVVNANEMNVAKEDAFTAIHGLWQLRATAYDARGEESRYLADDAPNRRSAYADAFAKKVSAVAGTTDGDKLSKLAAQDASETSADGIGGFFGQELSHKPFPGEREAALASINEFANYLRIDSQIRDLEASGQHVQAVALAIGTLPGQSGYQFSRFDDALGMVIAIDQKHFDAALASATASISPLLWAVPLALLVAWLSALLGLAPRIKEYFA